MTLTVIPKKKISPQALSCSIEELWPMLKFFVAKQKNRHTGTKTIIMLPIYFSTPYKASEWDIFHIKNNQLIILFIIYLINIIIFNFFFLQVLNEKK